MELILEPSGLEPAPAVDAGCIARVVHHLLTEANQSGIERRTAAREPFFRPVTVTLMQTEAQQFSCFSKDISATGIGLLHCMPLPLGEVTLAIRSEAGEPVHIKSELVWCRFCGAGWYLSGALFLEMLPPGYEGKAGDNGKAQGLSDVY